MHGNAGVMGHVDRRERGSPIDARQPAGIAMGEDVELRGLACPRPQGLDHHAAVIADGAALLHVRVGNGGSAFERGIRALLRRQAGKG